MKNKIAALHEDYPQWINDQVRKLIWRVHKQDER